MNWNFAFITLIVNHELPKDQKQLWYNVVESAGPIGIQGSAEVRNDNQFRMTNRIISQHGKNHHYSVVLTRDLTESEAEKIALAWSRAWPAGNFAVDFSQTAAMMQRVQEVADKKLQEIIDTVAKRHHTNWYKSKVDQGWSYGPRLDSRNKKHPMLVPWDGLSDKYQEQEYDQISSMFEALGSLGLKITRRS